MRRVLAAALLATAVLAPAASAAPIPPPCAYWVHGCDLPAYVYDVCEHYGIDCSVV
jgi:hypothetical protein